MAEGDLTSELLQEVRPVLMAFDTGLALKHNDALTSGEPDFSITTNKRTSWWEAKVAIGPLKIKHSNALQHLNMRRLAIAAHSALYVVWVPPEVTADGRAYTLIVEPKNIGPDGAIRHVHSEAYGINHRFVVELIVKVHGL